MITQKGYPAREDQIRYMKGCIIITYFVEIEPLNHSFHTYRTSICKHLGAFAPYSSKRSAAFTQQLIRDGTTSTPTAMIIDTWGIKQYPTPFTALQRTFYSSRLASLVSTLASHCRSPRFRSEACWIVGHTIDQHVSWLAELSPIGLFFPLHV